MPRNRKRKTEIKYNFEVLLKAIELARTGKAICSVAKQNSIPRQTLYSWLIGEPKKFGRGRLPVLNDGEEKTIIDAIDFCDQCGIPVGRDAVRDMVQSYLRSRKKKNPFTNDRPGKDWCRLFEKRNEDMLSERKLELVKKAKRESLTNKVNTFFDLYERVLSQNQLMNNPHRIFNLVEMGLNTNRDCKKLYATKERANDHLTSSNEGKGMYTVMFCISASGVYLPPFTLFKAKHMRQSWTKGGPHRAAYGLSDSGWMMDKNFENWFITIFVKFVNHYEKPVLLMYNRHISHLTYDTVKSAKENQIIILCLPPNTPNALQPLDVGVFSSVKEEWWKIINSWFHNTQNSPVTKEVFPSLLKQLWESLLPALAIDGFKGSGLYPPNRNVKAQEVLVSSANYFEGFEEVQSPMTDTVTSVPIASPESELKIKDAVFHNITLLPSKDLKVAQELNNKRKARFEEIMMQILQEEQTT